jgi:predicted AlkP superfamily phosphohydrolase/phosphomutase
MSSGYRPFRHLAVAVVLLLAGGPAGAAGPPAAKAIVISWDGAGDREVDRLLAEGRLPALAALAARGLAAEWSRSSFPSKTAAAHAALWTGAWAAGNGIPSNEVPLLPPERHTLLERRAGFDSAALTAEPLYVTAARAGRRVVALAATQSVPPGRWLEQLRQEGVPAGRLAVLGGFEQEVAGGTVVDAAAFGPRQRGWTGLPRHLAARTAREATVVLGEETLHLLLFDDPGDPVRGLDSLLVRVGSRDRRRAGAELRLSPRPAGGEPRGWSAPLRVRRGDLAGNTFLRLFELAPDGSRVLLYLRRAHALLGTVEPAEMAAYEAACPGFQDSGFAAYQQGALGVPLAAGGDGEAERRVLEIVAFDTGLLAAGSEFVLRAWRPDLMLHYSLLADDAGHAWMGLLDPAAPGHDPALAARLWPFYAGVFERLDGWLGALVAAAPPETVVAVVSDHGLAGVHRLVNVNRILEEAGLLAWDGAGRLDLSRTRAAAPFSDFMVRINGRERPGGIVAPEEREEVLRRAAAALLGASDPEVGGSPVRLVVRPAEVPGFGLAPPLAGELLFDLAPGYYPWLGRADVSVSASPRTTGSGEHGFWPERRDMHAIFYAAGPGIRPGARPGEVRLIDVAPTLARLLGLPVPPQATGRVIEEALAP